MYVTAKRWGVIAVLLVLCLAPLQSTDFVVLNEQPSNYEVLQGPQDILLMGNSYTSANNLDNLVDGVMGAASVQTNVSSLTSGGLKLSHHASNVASSGHQWNTTLKGTSWDWVVLQDQSQIPGFPRANQEWINSKNGAIDLNLAIERNGGETVLLMTWGRRDGDSLNSARYPDYSTMQDELAAGYLDYRDNMSSANRPVWVAPAGLAFEHIHDQIIADGGTPTDSGTLFHDLYSSDGSHPSLSGSYLAACVLYASITGDDPVGLSHSTSLSNARVLELQQAASATVFNETSHIDYPWQLQNQLPPINLSAIPDGALAWEWVEQFGKGDDVALSLDDVTVDQNNSIYIVGSYNWWISPKMSVGSCVFPDMIPLFVMKLNPNGNCSWITNVTLSVSGGEPQETMTSITHDLLGNTYVTGYFDGVIGSGTYNFNNNNSTAFSFTPSSQHHGFVAKINSFGEWQWLEDYPDTRIRSVGVISHNQIIISGEVMVIQNSWESQPFIQSVDSNGNQDWIKYVTLGADNSNSGRGNMRFEELSIGSSGEIVVIGEWKELYQSAASHRSFYFDSHSINSTDASMDHKQSTFVAKMDNSGNWQWAKTWGNVENSNYGYSVDVDSNDNVFIAGSAYGSITAAGTTVDSGSNENGYIAKLDSNGSWLWLKTIDCSCESSVFSISADVHDNVIISGRYSAPIQMGSIQLTPIAGGTDIYFAKIDGSGSWQFAIGAGTSQTDLPTSVFTDRSGNAYLTGVVDVGTATYGEIDIKNTGNSGNDGFIAKLTSDYDGDGEPDTIDDDDDDDYILDIYDKCHYSPIGFESIAAFDHDSDGCRDTDEDDDDDGDGVNDSIDDCERGMTRWTSTNKTDLDSDGCMDALEDYDDDADGFEDYLDFCPRLAGNSTNEFEKGCPDYDGDGRPDILDPFMDDPTEWEDTDGDRAGDNSDEFPYDASQQADSDGDGYGDQPYGNNGDACPTISGTSQIDRRGCIDRDGDGWSDEGDDFPDDATEHLDTDGDEVPDHMDEFPFEPTQWRDSDGDGYGDNSKGNQGDIWPDDPSRHYDSDRDGVADSHDDFPFDPTQWVDADGDGMGDNPMGIGADHFPNDPSQWGDIDGDGYGDNQSGNNSDDFPIDSTQWSDSDGDGYGDNPTGRLYDIFPNNPTQWEDNDGDGLGDNQNGTDADPYLNDEDNDGYNDTIDILPKFASPGDLDADGCMDEDDAFPSNPLECLDSDGDGIGNNADADDDNDKWIDADEIRAGTDPLSANETPVDSFEIQIGNIGLGAWDLIGMLGGIPIFSWIAFGLITRNGRCSRYEDAINSVVSREELESVAEKWEFSLMLRLLGPHQGIRLERLRAEVDDELEHAERLMAEDDESDPLTTVDHTSIVDEHAKALPSISNPPAFDAVPDQTDEDGYSWIEYDGAQWYKEAYSNSEWVIFEE
jgi:hypothetical protein